MYVLMWSVSKLVCFDFVRLTLQLFSGNIIVIGIRDAVDR